MSVTLMGPNPICDKACS